MYYYPSVFHALLHAGVDINKTDNFGVSALHMSTDPKISKILETLLLFPNVDINIQDQYGSTPLHYATWHGDYDTVVNILDKGGNLRVEDAKGKTPLDIVVERNHLNLSGLLSDVEEYVFGPHLRIDDSGSITKYINNTISSNTDGFLNAVLPFPGLGKIDDSKSFMIMKNEVNTFVANLAEAVEKLDDRFSMIVIPSGSVYEGTKCGLPDEFDFMLVLDKFSETCDVEYETDGLAVEPGFVILKQQENIPKRFEEFFEMGGVLNKAWVMKCLTHLTETALKLYILPTEHLTLFTSTHDMRLTGASVNIQVKWRCSVYKELTINIDLVPVLHYLNMSPPDNRGNARLLSSDAIKETGLYVVLLKCMDSPDKYWRISYSCCEANILTNFSEVVKDGYILAKTIRSIRLFKKSDCSEVTFEFLSEYENCRVEFNCVSTYTLKTAFLHLLEDYEEEMKSFNSVTICKKIYEYLSDRYGNMKEDANLATYFVPEMRIWHANMRKRWKDIVSAVKKVEEFFLQ